MKRSADRRHRSWPAGPDAGPRGRETPQDTPGRAIVGLGLIGFASGAAALIFEALWFNLAGLAFGNSVWASSLVIASFMAGLAVGSGLIAAYGRRLRHPLRFYAQLEAAIAISGVAVVFLLPRMTPLLAPLLRPLVDQPGLLNLARLALALAIMIVPATAMGATLPVVVTALCRRQIAFGRALGWLYGANTLGGVVGVLASEWVLIAALGVPGTAVVAAVLNGGAAALAWTLAARHGGETATATPGPPHSAAPRIGVPLLAAALLSGGLLLALEVVWFRLLLLFIPNTSLTFALMLAVILTGIAAGGWIAALWLARAADADRWLPALALLAGSATVWTYAPFRWIDWPLTDAPWALACRLMLPGALLSGVIFTLLGHAVRRDAGDETEAAGRLTLANTAGAMIGALAAGFLVLPRIGIERSIFALAAAYVVVAAATWRGASWRRHGVSLVAGLALLVSLALFPSGITRDHYAKHLAGSHTLLESREGLTETVTYLRADWAGRPHHYLLVTNSHAMATSDFVNKRYMKLYVYWALAAHPEARRALLVCYGVGNTAKALTDSAGLQSIDVVDISRDVLDLAALAYPPPQTSPLADPRVRVHVEDGRFFLLTTDRRFDLITAEPPPPKNTGVVNLYSREYFSLLHDRLDEGGVVTYWLPVTQLEVSESQAVTKAFCSVFADCSLWTGGAGQWMLAGTRHGRGPGTVEAFERQWKDARAGPEMRRLGFETPETLGALFIADASQLADWTKHARPLEDSWPRRIAPEVRVSPDAVLAYRRYADADASRARFLASRWVRTFWPEPLRSRSADFFGYRGILEDLSFGRTPAEPGTLHALLTRSPLSTLPLLLMGLDPTRVDIARALAGSGVRDGTIELALSADALARRDVAAAGAHLRAATSLSPGLEATGIYRTIAAELQTAAK